MVRVLMGAWCVSLLSVAACVPHSIAEAVAKRHDEFPRNSYVLVPPADLERLGETVERLDGRRARPTGTKCFDVVPVRGKGLEKIELSYKAGKEFKAEVKTLAANAGADLKDDDTAHIVLDGLKVVEGIGIPNRNSACGFRDGEQTVEVITAIVVASSATIEFSRNMSFTGSGNGGWSAGTGSGSGNVGVSSSQSGKLNGTNIVVTGSTSKVTVALSRSEKDVGATPALGEVVAFPSGFDGNVRIDVFQTATPDGIPILSITPNTALNGSLQGIPDSMKACKPGTRAELKPGDGCFVWDRSGTSGVNIWFEKKAVSGAEHVIVHTDGYRTTFAPTP